MARIAPRPRRLQTAGLDEAEWLGNGGNDGMIDLAGTVHRTQVHPSHLRRDHGMGRSFGEEGSQANTVFSRSELALSL